MKNKLGPLHAFLIDFDHTTKLLQRGVLVALIYDNKTALLKSVLKTVMDPPLVALINT